jgi:ribose transport system permease protein
MNAVKTWTGRFFSQYGMVIVLLLLCAYYSWVTLAEQHPTGAPGGRHLGTRIRAAVATPGRALIVARANQEDTEFARAVESALRQAGWQEVTVVTGGPAEARAAMDSASALDVIACSPVAATWSVIQDVVTLFPKLASVRVFKPESYRWPNFLKTDNLLNVANQIVVIAIIAIGMTMVIITAGIDLSVGSLIALSAVVTAWLIRSAAGAEAATAWGMTWCCLAGLGVCAGVGLFSGVMVTAFSIPPFIVTLAMMLVASGLAYQIAQGQSIYQVPESFIWLGRGTSIGGLPNAVLLMAVLYAIAHVVMSRMTLGRYIYAVGGNREAARLSGVPVQRVLLVVYTLSGLLAGLGGIVMASQLKSGSPTYGQMYELSVIAAVVVGGTSLSGGEGKVLGTLVGAFIIAVIQNGMNLTNVESYTQKVVLGLVILGAVLLDMLKKRGWLRWRRKK